MESIAQNLEHVMDRIAAAAARAGRDPSEVSLVAVTKNMDPTLMNQAVALGVKNLGENRVQEAESKIPLIEGNVSWHLVGHLQRNKVKRACELFSVIHSLDSIALAEELDCRVRQSWEGSVSVPGGTRTPLDTLVQVNVSGEASKFGIRPEQARAFMEEMPKYEGLRVIGLMTIAPYSSDPEDARVWFRKARELRDELSGISIPNVKLDNLSMGMSNDYEVAVEEGATMVRIGTAIFGPRTY